MADTAWQCALCEGTLKGTLIKRSKRRVALCTWCDAELRRKGQDFCTGCRTKVTASMMATGRAICRACDRARQQRYNRAREPSRQAERLRTARERWEQRHTDDASYAARRRERRIARYRRDPEPERAAARARYYQIDPEERRRRRRARYQRHTAQERAAARARYQRKKLAIWRGER